MSWLRRRPTAAKPEPPLWPHPANSGRDAATLRWARHFAQAATGCAHHRRVNDPVICHQQPEFLVLTDVVGDVPAAWRFCAEHVNDFRYGPAQIWGLIGSEVRPQLETVEFVAATTARPVADEYCPACGHWVGAQIAAGGDGHTFECGGCDRKLQVQVTNAGALTTEVA
jgi:hypothetical protein